MEVEKYCTSCYATIKNQFAYCYKCNQQRDTLPVCDKFKKDGNQCKNKTSMGSCYYHKKKETTKYFKKNIQQNEEEKNI